MYEIGGIAIKMLMYVIRLISGMYVILNEC